MPTENTLAEQAADIDRLFHAVRRTLRAPIDREAAGLPLTGPQRRAMMLLARPGAPPSMTLKELTGAMGLSQSTVSGIVERLERLGVLTRSVDPLDRRLTRIAPSEEVRQFMQREMPARRMDPLLRALERATPAERDAIRRGLELLEHLLAQG